MYQTAAWYLSIILMALITVIFITVVLKTNKRREYEPIQKKWYRFRTIYFLVLLVVFGTLTYFTLQDLPFERPVYGQEENPVIVDVEAVQFGWNMSQMEFKVGEPIEFDITSSDVNHGFGIYDKDMNLLAQTQAMPDYTNTVYYTFSEPGTYQILCMEYCGLAHHLMVGEIVVTN
ncbi:cytochrome C oxidase subunit II [Fredinandcohnia sp. FSL W7-1320]|uniref:cytochrome C oxidase subunit II n=1 Tax=Fredinandcohnia sp. FSL W7-1320 TaxID=2954540 RepID=UPI0030FD9249